MFCPKVLLGIKGWQTSSSGLSSCSEDFNRPLLLYPYSTPFRAQGCIFWHLLLVWIS